MPAPEKRTRSSLFLLGGLLFPDPLTNRLHFLVIEIHETDADAFGTGPLRRVRPRPGDLTGAVDLGLFIGEDKLDRKTFSGLEGTFGRHEQAADADVLCMADEYLVVFSPPDFQHKQGQTKRTPLFDKGLEAVFIGWKRFRFYL